MPSTPKHVYLYQAFGWKVPAFVHLGLLQNADGTKLSKRHGGDNVNVEWYIAQGYLPQAIVNFVALLGWRNPRSNDVMDMTALIDNVCITSRNPCSTIISKTTERLIDIHFLSLEIVHYHECDSWEYDSRYEKARLFAE